MINTKYLKILELDKVLDMLAEETCCETARNLALSIQPEADVDEVLRSLKRTDDAFNLTLRFGTPSFTGLTDPTPRLKVAMAGGILSPRDLLNIGAVLRQSRSLSQWAHQFAEEENSITEELFSLYLNNPLEREISTDKIGEMVMERLKPLDEVAYIRFASIYHRFQDAQSFMREISKFLEEK